ncbi:MAG: mechanosensitive ion channel family protein [Haloferacaceae archaeon]
MIAGGTAVRALAAGAWAPPAVALPPQLQGRLPRAIIALLLIVAGIYLSKFLVRLLEAPVAARVGRESITQMILRSVRIVAVAAAAVVAGSLFGLRATDLLLSVTVFSAVLGLVLAPVIGNIVNGLFVLADQPYEIGDMIELQNGTKGFVDDITLRYTKVFTLDNTFTVIPNASIREQQVVNYSAEDKRTRLALPILVTYGSDVGAAQDVFERAARSCEGVIDGGPDIRIGSSRYPAKPTAYIDEHADSGIRIRLRYWVEQPYKLLAVRSDVQTAIRRLLAERDADVEIAYPHRRLVFDDDLGAAGDGTEPAAAGASGEPARSGDAGPGTPPDGFEG